VNDPLSDTLDFALIARLREVLDRRPATESELRALTEQAEAWARTVTGQIQSSERRIRRLSANPASSLSQIASELRRVDKLRPQLNEVRTLLGDLEKRAREVRTEWLLSQATSARVPSGNAAERLGREHQARGRTRPRQG
jgi:chromosome segregation ATPase